MVNNLTSKCSEFQKNRCSFLNCNKLKTLIAGVIITKIPTILHFFIQMFLIPNSSICLCIMSQVALPCN